MPNRVDQLKKLLEADPKDPFCLYGLAQEYAREGDTEEALAWYDRTIEADPHYHYAYYHKARCLADDGDEAAAKGVLEIGLAQAREDDEAHAAAEIEAFLDELG